MKQVTMESISQRIADLESAGKVVGGLSLSSEFELACLRELVAVTEQRDALAAEASSMHAAIEQTISWQQSVDAGNTESVRMLLDLKTPATSSAIAALRAEGVEMLAERRKKAADIARQRDDLCIADSLEGEAIRAQMFANELRESKGAQS